MTRTRGRSVDAMNRSAASTPIRTLRKGLRGVVDAWTQKHKLRAKRMDLRDRRYMRVGAAVVPIRLRNLASTRSCIHDTPPKSLWGRLSAWT